MIRAAAIIGAAALLLTACARHCCVHRHPPAQVASAVPSFPPPAPRAPVRLEPDEPALDDCPT